MFKRKKKSKGSGLKSRSIENGKPLLHGSSAALEDIKCMSMDQLFNHIKTRKFTVIKARKMLPDGSQGYVFRFFKNLDVTETVSTSDELHVDVLQFDDKEFPGLYRSIDNNTLFYRGEHAEYVEIIGKWDGENRIMKGLGPEEIEFWRKYELDADAISHSATKCKCKLLMTYNTNAQ